MFILVPIASALERLDSALSFGYPRFQDNQERATNSSSESSIFVDYLGNWNCEKCSQQNATNFLACNWCHFNRNLGNFF